MEETITMATEECQELKNIRYKTMLLNGTPLSESKSDNNLSNLEKFLEAEQISNSNEPWCKLNKTIKFKKLLEYVSVYSKENKLEDDETELLTTFLKESIDKKKLSRVKDVIYDKTTGMVKEIPALMYTKTNKHFTLKNIDKRISTLKSLSVKKSNVTIRHKEMTTDKDDSGSDNEN